MNSLQKISDLKAYQKAHDSIFTTLITRHISRFLSFCLLKLFKNITPNKVSVMSLCSAILACLLFIHPNYWYKVLGVILMQLSFALDCSDGEIARFKNMGSKFGAWFDSVSDRFKEILMFSALTYNWYSLEKENYVIIIGAAAIIGWLLIGYLREAKKSSWPVTRKAELYITKTIYIGTVDVIIFLVCFSVLFKIENYILIFFVITSLPLVLKQVRSAWKLSQN